jgi:hypothetical protein
MGAVDGDNQLNPEIPSRVYDAYCRLFAKVGLDFASAPSDVLFDAFVTMVNQLPDQWLTFNVRRYCSDAEIAAGSNLPRRLTVIISFHGLFVRGDKALA